MACAQGALSRLYVEPGASPHVFDTSSETYEFLNEAVQQKGRVIGGHGIRGTRSSSVERVRLGASEYGGPILMNLDTAMLDLMLPRMLGGTESADSFPLAETLPAFGLLIDRVTGTFEYKDSYIGQWLIHGKAGPDEEELELVELQIEVACKSEFPGTTAPAVSLATGSNSNPYIFADTSSGVTISGTAREIKEFWLWGNNHLQSRYVNSLNPTAICPRDRTIGLRLRCPYDSGVSALYGGSATGVTASLAFTNAVYTGLTTTFTFGKLVYPAESPVVRGKTEIDVVFDFIAKKTGATNELVVTSDSVA